MTSICREMGDKGYMCAETVLHVLADKRGIKADVGAATPFCAGMARTMGPCGALTGALIFIGLELGRHSPGPDAEHSACFAASQALIKKFKERVGSTNCHDIVGLDFNDEKDMARYVGEDFKNKVCLPCVEAAVELTLEILEKRDDDE